MRRRQLQAFAMAIPVTALLGVSGTAHADPPAASVPCNVAALNAAIVAANNNTGPHTLRLASRCDYDIHTPASSGGLGDNALPKITDTVTLLGHDTTISRDPDAPAGFRIAEIDGPNGKLTVDGITATGGGYLDYAGTYLPTNGGTLILRHSVVTNSTANQGGAIFVNLGSTLEVDDSVLKGISAQRGGAIYNGPGSTTRLNNTKIEGNQATEFGGGIFTAGVSLTIKNSSIVDNRAFNQGGGIYNDRVPMDVDATTIASNRAGLMGGGIANYGSSVLKNSVVRRNSALNGGGIWQDPALGSVTLLTTKVVENTPNNCRPTGSVNGCTS